jgi:hypothetical protein
MEHLHFISESEVSHNGVAEDLSVLSWPLYRAFQNVLRITNIYNNKTKALTLVELFTDTGKLKKGFWQLEIFDVCTTGDTAHIDTIFKFLSHTRQHECIDILHCCNDPCLKALIIVAALTVSTQKYNKYHLPHIHILPPDDGLLMCPKHVEVW